MIGLLSKPGAIIRDTVYIDGGWLYSINSTESMPTTPCLSSDIELSFLSDILSDA
jgi:hypothetical protein